MRKAKIWKSDIYSATVHYMIGWTGRQAETYSEKIFRLPLDVGDCQGLTKAMTRGRLHVVIWTKAGLSQKSMLFTLAHECLHATSFILDHAGVKADFQNDEAQAYLLGTIFEMGLGR